MSPVRVVALLGPDNAGDVVAATLAAAPGPVDVAVHEISPYLTWALVDAAAAGHPVRLLLDAHTADGANPAALVALRDGPVEVRRIGGRPGSAAHWKLLVVGEADNPRATLLVGTGNLIRRDLPRHDARRPAGPLAGTREWWVAVHGAPRLLGAARAAIRAAWSGHDLPRVPAPGPDLPPPPPPPPVGTPDPQVAPFEADVAEARCDLAAGVGAAADLITTHVSGARRRLWVTVPYVHARVPAVSALLEVLAAGARAGADVRLLLGQDPTDHAAATPAEIAGRGVPVRVMSAQTTTRGHAKGVVADGTVVVSSVNWSRAAFEANLEAAIAVADPRVAGYFGAAFARDWDASR